MPWEDSSSFCFYCTFDSPIKQMAEGDTSMRMLYKDWFIKDQVSTTQMTIAPFGWQVIGFSAQIGRQLRSKVAPGQSGGIPGSDLMKDEKKLLL
ncbi:hypothetical protein OPV22_006491 [Ensete ventricosum]|uniref:Uncharacterized protein n=1 Tax=Ensete ventricosum TaxID=4639 RepID=A0AAV8RTC8_ENSVE|nr:hypothetical protein OPV22_006491 [Ensete ventricosum]